HPPIIINGIIRTPGIYLMILAIDIGGTKFTIAVLQGTSPGTLPRLLRRESRATDALGGRSWMLGQIGEIVRQWGRDFQLDKVGHRLWRSGRFRRTARSTLYPHRGWHGYDL